MSTRSRLHRLIIHRASSSALFLMSMALLLLTAPGLQAAAGGASAQTLLTDKDNLPLSNQFGPPYEFVLTNGSDVFFGSDLALFRWNSIAGRSRVLQWGDPYPNLPGSNTDIVGSTLRVNAGGHLAMVNTYYRKGARDDRGVFVYDGAAFRKVVSRGDVVPGTGGKLFFNFAQPFRFNDSDQVAFIAQFEPRGVDDAGVFIGSPTGALVKIAVLGDPAPGTGGGTFRGFRNVLGLNNATPAQVAFLADITGGSTSLGVFLGSTAGVSKVAAQGDPAPGTGSGTFLMLGGGALNYALNDSNVAFRARVQGGTAGAGIWIGDGSASPSKLIANTDPTTTSGLTTFGQINALMGFNNSGKALFSSDPNTSAGPSPTHALFLKSLSSPEQVVFKRGDSVPGSATQHYYYTLQASLTNSGDIPVLAQLFGAPAPEGWFLASASGPAVKIAFEGDATPAGGTFGLRGEDLGFQSAINSSREVLFIADILGPNNIGLFRWTPAAGIVSVVNTGDALPPGANQIVRTAFPAASDDRLLFDAYKAGGRVSVFTKPLKPGSGQITRLFGDGDAAPGVGGALWRVSADIGMINVNEEAAFVAYAVGGSVYPATLIFTHKPGVGLQKIAATGDPAPGAAGGTFGFDAFALGLTEARINSAGQVAFLGFIDGSASNQGIFIGSATGGVQAAARSGDPSPVGGTFLNFPGSNLVLSDSGQVAFRADSQVGPNTVTGLFVGSGSAAPGKVVAFGDAGPGGSSVVGLPNRFRMNNAGQVAYMASLSSTTPEGVFLGTAGGPQFPIALVGDTAPGTGGGTFGEFGEGDVRLNGSAQVSFSAAVNGSSAATGYFLGAVSTPTIAHLLQGQALPGGGQAGLLSLSRGGSAAPEGSRRGFTTLNELGQVAVRIFNVTGAPNLGRQVIADADGTLYRFITYDEKAPETGGSLFTGPGFDPCLTPDNRFLTMTNLVDGQSKSGIFLSTLPR